jgi:hypothetical protein
MTDHKPPIEVTPISAKSEIKAPKEFPKEVSDRINRLIAAELRGVLPKCNYCTLVTWPLEDEAGTTKLAIISTFGRPQDIRALLEAVVQRLEGLDLSMIGQ